MKGAADMMAKKYVQSNTVDTVLNEGLRTSRGMMVLQKSGLNQKKNQWRRRVLQKVKN